ncbi:MAG TPA: DUF2461 domain-containing protein [Bryobacteraceae bacterium]|jgi:uncharacterized protein (TIGR02453 family)|nr:DUF2461 domain-containing protein [Bryobacteraceae bacterium]
MPNTAKLSTADAVPAFSGFPKAGIRFLRDLKRNNDREWFRERKHIYEEAVRAPMESLLHEIAAACQARGFALHAKHKNPVMRIYRDIRFSSDKSPFHTHVGGALKQSHSKTAFGGMYIHISPGQSFVAAGFWMPERPFVQAWRNAMAADPKRFARVLSALEKQELDLARDRPLTRFPRGFEAQADSPLADIFKLVSYIVHRPVQAAEYSSEKMVHIATDFALAARPLLEYGWALNYSPRRDILADGERERP